MTTTVPPQLTDSELNEVSDLVRLLPPWRRQQFMEALAYALQNVERGPGAIRAVGAAVMRDVLRAPREDD